MYIFVNATFFLLIFASCFVHRKIDRPCHRVNLAMNRLASKRPAQVMYGIHHNCLKQILGFRT